MTEDTPVESMTFSEESFTNINCGGTKVVLEPGSELTAGTSIIGKLGATVLMPEDPTVLDLTRRRVP